MPNDPKFKDDFELLRAAVDISSDPDFREKRTAHWHWQRDIFGEGIFTDEKRLEDAVNQMRELVEEEKAILNKHKVGFRVSLCFTLASVALGFIPPAPIALAIGGAFLGLGAFLVDKFTTPPEQPRPAAMCYTVQKAFGML